MHRDSLPVGPEPVLEQSAIRFVPAEIDARHDPRQAAGGGVRLAGGEQPGEVIGRARPRRAAANFT